MAISLQADIRTEPAPKVEMLTEAAVNRRADLAQLMAEFSAYVDTAAKSVVKAQAPER